MHHPKGFPSKLVRLRADAEMTQRDLSKASGISVPQIGRYEMGTSVPRMTALVKLAKALGVEVSELTNASDEPATVQIVVTAEGKSGFMVALPKDLLDDLQSVADRHGVSLEVIMAASIQVARLRDEGSDVNLGDVISDVAVRYAKLPKN